MRIASPLVCTLSLALSAGCAGPATVPVIRATESAAVPLGIAQAEPGWFVVCRNPCPAVTPKTPYSLDAESPVTEIRDDPKTLRQAATPVVVPRVPRLTVHFAFDRADVRPGDRSALAALAGDLGPRSVVHVHGYTDDIGPEPYNHSLALARADAVAEILARAGIPRGRIAVAGHARCCFVESNEHPAGRAANRRAEIFIRPRPSGSPSKE